MLPLRRRVTGYAKLQKCFTPEQAAYFLKDLHHLSEVVTLGDVPVLSKNPADNLIIATALAGEADYLVTRDKRDLLHLREVESIPSIIAPNLMGTTVDQVLTYRLKNWFPFNYCSQLNGNAQMHMSLKP